MRLAIVGSHTSPGANWNRAVRNYIRIQLSLWCPELVISGGAEFVDKWAIEEAKMAGIETVEYKARVPVWNGSGGYKDRNIVIADECTHLLRITHPLQATQGSGWTLRLADSLGKPTKDVVINRSGTQASAKLRKFPDNDNTTTGYIRDGADYGASETLL